MRFHFLLIPGNTYEILPGNEAAADRTPAFGEHFVADFVGRDQAKRVRVHRRPALAVENDVYGRVECDVAAGDMQAPGRARLFDDLVDDRGLDRIGLESGEAEDDRLVGRMACSRPGQ